MRLKYEVFFNAKPASQGLKPASQVRSDISQVANPATKNTMKICDVGLSVNYLHIYLYKTGEQPSDSTQAPACGLRVRNGETQNQTGESITTFAGITEKY
ncbi:MAG: hypothetical protein LBT50_11530 [Prevotellaceae bacterium]|nr:hypothetical protein [Prevotellaceae bacterium]